MAVSGPVSPSSLEVVDAHNHLWIEALDGVSPDSPHLTEYDAILLGTAGVRSGGRQRQSWIASPEAAVETESSCSNFPARVA